MTVRVERSSVLGGVSLVHLEDLDATPSRTIQWLMGERLWVSRGGTVVLHGPLCPHVLAAVVSRLTGMGCFYRVAHSSVGIEGAVVLWSRDEWQTGKSLSAVIAEENERRARRVQSRACQPSALR